ncbi:MAG: carboxypeptidase-like regulatory domain-containing protein, partial [Bryobacteraceae bacterium]|nr:carboxypeptidase-like regulatory domain-containing protein [Bryobacteraceae bacterium]
MRNTVFAVFLVSAALFAQSPDANISGTVRDAQGALVIGAQVTARSIATDAATTATTNDSGLYSLRNLQIGEYTVNVTMPGFRRYERKGLTLSTGASVELDIALEVGAVTDTVTVTATAQQLETRTSDVSQLVDTKTVEDVPLGDRRTMNLINLMPAAVFVNYDSGSKPNFSLAGGRTQSQNFFIDGGTGQNMRLGVGQIDMDPPVETVAEVKVLSNN